MSSTIFQQYRNFLFKADPTTVLNLCSNHQNAKKICISGRFWEDIYLNEFPHSHQFHPIHSTINTLTHPILQQREHLYGPWVKDDIDYADRTPQDWKNMYIRDTHTYKIKIITHDKHIIPFFISFEEPYSIFLYNLKFVLNEYGYNLNDYNIQFTFNKSKYQLPSNDNRKLSTILSHAVISEPSNDIDNIHKLINDDSAIIITPRKRTLRKNFTPHC